MLTVASCTARMPPHMTRVLRYQRGKLPLVHASTKLPRSNGPEGVNEAMSGGTPGRSAATAIQAKGTAHSNAAALAASSARSLPSAFILNPALDQAKRGQAQRQKRGDTDHGRRRREPGIVILRRLLVDVIEQQVGRVGWTAPRHRHNMI